MKIDKLSLDGKKTPIEIKDEIFSSKINESLIKSGNLQNKCKLQRKKSQNKTKK